MIDLVHVNAALNVQDAFVEAYYIYMCMSEQAQVSTTTLTSQESPP